MRRHNIRKTLKIITLPVIKRGKSIKVRVRSRGFFAMAHVHNIAELAQLSEGKSRPFYKSNQRLKSYSELQSQRDTLTRLREDNRKIRSDYDELQLRFDDEVYSSGGWRKEKERLETKIADVTNAYDASAAAQTEQQSQIVALHSQVRELRGVLDDVEADRALLQKARRALQAELEGIKLDHVDTQKMSTDQQFQRLLLEKQDLERSLDEQEDRVVNAFDRMKKAESFANECQIELGKVRVDNSELDRINVSCCYLSTQMLLILSAGKLGESSQGVECANNRSGNQILRELLSASHIISKG